MDGLSRRKKTQKMILSTTEKKEELKLAETLSKKTHFSPHVNFLTKKEEMLV